MEFWPHVCWAFWLPKSSRTTSMQALCVASGQTTWRNEQSEAGQKPIRRNEHWVSTCLAMLYLLLLNIGLYAKQTEMHSKLYYHATCFINWTCKIPFYVQSCQLLMSKEVYLSRNCNRYTSESNKSLSGLCVSSREQSKLRETKSAWT